MCIKQNTRGNIMNNSINCSGFVEMFMDSFDDFEPYGYSVMDAELEHTQINSQLKAAGINDIDYKFTGE